ncbi:arginine transporter [Octadecabacter sp.]|nr:arginine transporter [Octadecabacter sp.]
MKNLLILSALVALTACSGGRDRLSSGSTAGATGPISRACLAADRSAASTSLCACVQRVANAELSTRDRARMVRFFADPKVAHATKISDTPANDDFWRRYQAFVRSARSQCG